MNKDNKRERVDNTDKKLHISDVVQHAEKANAQIGTFGFCRSTSQTQKTKRAYFLPALESRNRMIKLNLTYKR